MAHLKLTLLGAPRLEVGAKPINFDTRKAMALLAYLAVSRQRHTRDALIALFWPESDRTRGRSALRRTLSPLNQALGGRWLDADNETLALAPDAAFWLDVDHVQRCVASWRAHGHTQDQLCDACLAALAEAAALYRDHFMAGFTLGDCPEFDNWQTYQRESLNRIMTGALAQLAQGHAARRQLAQAIAYAQQLLALDPLHEPTHRQLMLLHIWAGDRAAALRQYETCARLLHTELGAEPLEETQHLHRTISHNLAPPPPAPPAAGDPRGPAPRRHLPARLTSFVGRDQDVEAVSRLLQQARLVTLTGPGGCGKTSLAVETARALTESKPAHNGSSHAPAHLDSVHLVELLPLAEWTLLAQTILATLGLEGNPEQPAQQTLIAFFAGTRALLILDNCEHLVDAAAQLVEVLLRECPHLRVLATSRERLNIGPEVVYVVPSLALPADHETPGVGDMAGYAAVQLFVERSQAVTPGFRLTEQNAAAVLRICMLLDGLPLALELAAAATATFSPAEIAEQLEARQLLAGPGYRTADPRHQRLNDTVEWSYRLLNPTEQRTLVHLACFVGGWTLEAMRQILPTEDDPAKLLQQLVRKSLVGIDQAVRAAGSRTRYFLLRAIREYAAERLAADDAQDQVRTRHCLYYTAYATELGDQVMGPLHQAACSGLDADYHNIRAAVHFSLDKPHLADARVRMAAALTYYWRLRNHTLWAEGLTWLQAALEPQGDCSLPVQALGCGALLSLGCIDPFHSTLNLGAEWHGIRQRIAAGEALLAQPALTAGDPHSTGRLLLGLADAHRYPGGLAKCQEYAERAIEFLEAAGDLRNLGFASNILTWVELVQGNMQALESRQPANLRVAQASNSPWAMCEAYLAQAAVAGAANNPVDQVYYLKLLIALAEQQEFLSFLYAGFHWLEGIDAALALQLAQELAGRQRRRTHSRVLGLALHELGRLYTNAKQCEAAADALDEAIDFWRRGSGERTHSSALEWSLAERGNAAYLLGHYEAARRFLDESIALFAGVPFAGGSLWPHYYRGFTFLALDELHSAEADLRQCIRLIVDGFPGWQKLAVWGLGGLGAIACRRGDMVLGGQLLSAAVALDSQLPQPAAHAGYGEAQGFLCCLAAASAYHADPAFQQGWVSGQNLAFADAVALAVGAPTQTPHPTARR